MLQNNYSQEEWTRTRVYTDGSAGATKNGGSGIFIHYPVGRKTTKSFPVGRLATNYKAEICALKEAVNTISNGNGQWLMAYHNSQPPSALGLSNINLGLYLDG